MRYSDVPSLQDPASSAAGTVEAKTGSSAAGLVAAGAVGYLMRGKLGALIGIALAHFLKKKEPPHGP